MGLDGDKTQKVQRLRTASLLDQGWKKCPDGWQAPLFPVNADWQKYPERYSKLFDNRMIVVGVSPR
jgi:hypothetical protein